MQVHNNEITQNIYNKFLIWVDRNVFTKENIQFSQIFREQYGNGFQQFDQEKKATEFLEKNSNNNIVIITSGQCGYQLSYGITSNIESNIIIFCDDKSIHYGLFLERKCIKAICSKFDELNRIQKLIIKEKEIIFYLKTLAQPEQSSISTPEYQHSKQHVSIQFAVIIQKLNSSAQITQEMLFQEFKNLLKYSMIGNQSKTSQRDIEEIIKSFKQSIEKAEGNIKRKLTLFEMLIHVYTRQEIYRQMNSAFAKYQYQAVENILVTLFKGYSDLQKQNQISQQITLYRGINLEEKIYQKMIQEFKDAMQGKSSLIWNTPNSTTTRINVAQKFASWDQSKFPIVFIINLDNHPRYQIPLEIGFYNEAEVLLFPQFEFYVDEITKVDNILTVKIRQVKNSFHTIFQSHLRQTFWTDVFTNKLNPKISELIEILFLRPIYLKETLDSLKQNKQQIFADEMKDCFIKLQRIFKQIFGQDSIIQENINGVLTAFQEVCYEKSKLNELLFQSVTKIVQEVIYYLQEATSINKVDLKQLKIQVNKKFDNFYKEQKELIKIQTHENQLSNLCNSLEPIMQKICQNLALLEIKLKQEPQDEKFGSVLGKTIGNNFTKKQNEFNSSLN